MPREIFDKEKFLELAKYARECRVKKLGDVVKLKLRLKRYLYTYKTTSEEAEELLKQIQCPIREV
ncbi:MAG: hypothetical protein DRN04_00255 [Thermoprotei archaeon]|nr:MAG: hypothetical protein DRN04_00255 [Thermoprotei archaeon]